MAALGRERKRADLNARASARRQKLQPSRDHLIAPRRRVPKAARVQPESSLPRCSSGKDRRPTWQALTLTLLMAVVVGASIPGCTTEPSRNKDLLRRVLPPQPVLFGSAVYSGGVLTAECWLGPTVRLKKAGMSAGQGEHPEQGDPRKADLNFTGSPFNDGASNFSASEINEMYGRKNYENVLPPRSALGLRFTNSGAQPITFTIADVNSLLGDFLPRPETFTVTPGAHGTVEPMLSNRDDNFEELEVTLIIKTGTQKERHILKLSRPSVTGPRQ